MSSHTLICSAASADSNSLHSGQDFAQSDSPRSSHTPAASSPSVGPMFPTSATCESQPTFPGFEAALCSRVDSPASRGPLPGSEEARTMTATSGRQCSQLSRQSGRLGLLVRTCLGSSDWLSTTCVLNWKPEATPSSRLLFRLVPSMPSIGETEFGLWPTMTVVSAIHHGRVKLKPGQQTSLSQEVHRRGGLWPTPRASDREGLEAGMRRDSPGLGVVVRVPHLWPTPAAQDGKNGTLPPSQAARDTIPGAMIRSGATGSLNPQWVEWLMGYPIGHTALKGSETPSSRKSRTASRAGSRKSKGER